MSTPLIRRPNRIRIVQPRRMLTPYSHGRKAALAAALTAVALAAPPPPPPMPTGMLGSMVGCSYCGPQHIVSLSSPWSSAHR